MSGLEHKNGDEVFKIGISRSENFPKTLEMFHSNELTKFSKSYESGKVDHFDFQAPSKADDLTSKVSKWKGFAKLTSKRDPKVQSFLQKDRFSKSQLKKTNVESSCFLSKSTVRQDRTEQKQQQQQQQSSSSSSAIFKPSKFLNQHLLRAEEAAKDGDLHKAEALYTGILKGPWQKQAQKSAAFWLGWSKVHEALGDNKRVLELLTQAKEAGAQPAELMAKGFREFLERTGQLELLPSEMIFSVKPIRVAPGSAQKVALLSRSPAIKSLRSHVTTQFRSSNQLSQPVSLLTPQRKQMFRSTTPISSTLKEDLRLLSPPKSQTKSVTRTPLTDKLRSRLDGMEDPAREILLRSCKKKSPEVRQLALESHPPTGNERNSEEAETDDTTRNLAELLQESSELDQQIKSLEEEEEQKVFKEIDELVKKHAAHTPTLISGDDIVATGPDTPVEAPSSASKRGLVSLGLSARHTPKRVLNRDVASKASTTPTSETLILMKPVRQHGSSSRKNKGNSDFFLSPVRRSARKNKIQTAIEVQDLLAETNYSYQPNKALQGYSKPSMRDTPSKLLSASKKMQEKEATSCSKAEPIDETDSNTVNISLTSTDNESEGEPCKDLLSAFGDDDEEAEHQEAVKTQTAAALAFIQTASLTVVEEEDEEDEEAEHEEKEEQKPQQEPTSSRQEETSTIKVEEASVRETNTREPTAAVFAVPTLPLRRSNRKRSVAQIQQTFTKSSLGPLDAINEELRKDTPRPRGGKVQARRSASPSILSGDDKSPPSAGAAKKRPRTAFSSFGGKGRVVRSVVSTVPTSGVRRSAQSTPTLRRTTSKVPVDRSAIMGSAKRAKRCKLTKEAIAQPPRRSPRITKLKPRYL
mmetsp:Transcript_22569/g.44732  ORF Transcript_22569/g.44732 Transcript_22569/m.44732 type:complete len:866 (-) Transcript_22569:221-2818(-)